MKHLVPLLLLPPAAQFFDAVHEAVQAPSRVDFLSPAQTEAAQPLVAPDVGEDRPHRDDTAAMG